MNFRHFSAVVLVSLLSWSSLSLAKFNVAYEASVELGPLKNLKLQQDDMQQCVPISLFNILTIGYRTSKLAEITYDNFKILAGSDNKVKTYNIFEDLLLSPPSLKFKGQSRMIKNNYAVGDFFSNVGVELGQDYEAIVSDINQIVGVEYLSLIDLKRKVGQSDSDFVASTQSLFAHSLEKGTPVALTYEVVHAGLKKSEGSHNVTVIGVSKVSSFLGKPAFKVKLFDQLTSTLFEYLATVDETAKETYDFAPGMIKDIHKIKMVKVPSVKNERGEMASPFLSLFRVDERQVNVPAEEGLRISTGGQPRPDTLSYYESTKELKMYTTNIFFLRSIVGEFQ